MSMIYHGVEYFPVTTDEKLHEQLRDKAHEDTAKLTEYVKDLGLTPPNYRDGDPFPDVTPVVTPDGEIVIVWDIHEIEGVTDEDDQPMYDDDTDY